MPLPFASFLPLIGQGISSLGSLIGGGSQNRRNIQFQREANAQNIAFQKETNQQSMDFQRAMYAQQRQDSLADFTMQNDYNSPTSQMARLREGGLNPHLVYGNGGAITQAAGIRSSSAPTPSIHAPNVHAPQVDMSHIAAASNLSPYFQMQTATLQADNLKALNTKIETDTRLAAAKEIVELLKVPQMTEALTKAQRENLIGNATALLDIEHKGLRNEKLSADIKYTIDSNVRQAAANKQSIRESVERVIRSAAERRLIPYRITELNAKIKNLDLDSKIKAYEVRLNDMGVNKNDPAWQRYLGIFIKGILQYFNIDVDLTPENNEPPLRPVNDFNLK